MTTALPVRETLAERFRYQFVEAIRSQDPLSFKERFRSIDILLIDDLEFMHGQQTEQEFDHIINALLDGGRQVVAASALRARGVDVQRVLVVGAGVAGLQAIATARRLGAVVEGFDIRAAAGEAVRSLGATFLEVDLTGIETEDAGGYARELTEEAMERSRALIAKQARATDVIITSAQVPGRRAPLLVTDEALAGMKRGSVIVDLAAASGGNCAAISAGDAFPE